MLNESVMMLGKKRSVIRDLFEFGNQRAAVVGRENVYDFSLGNPNVPAPETVYEAILDILKEEAPEVTHAYTSAQGAEFVRKSIADDLNARFGTDYTANNFYMAVGAAAAISICFKTLTSSPEDEIIAFAPYFPEYAVFVRDGAGAKFVVVPPSVEDFQINFEAFEALINEHTSAVIVNSPNNPSGVVYSEATIQRLAEILRAKEAEYGHPIYIISDEPYRELSFDGAVVPWIPSYYDHTLVCYSYSKSLSMPGERIGYVLVPNTVHNFEDIYAAVCGAGRVLGYVNAPSLFQRVAARCTGQTADLSVYERNRELLYNALTSYGYKCVKPEGAFYMFPQTPEADDMAFCEKAKQYDLLVVPGTGFGAPGHIRISYCVKTDMIERALPVFKKLAEDYGILPNE